jgi:glycosyltransferase involved in cell wall biosynthesis
MKFHKIYVYAVNIHNGGGKTLLVSLLNAINSPAHIFVDERMQLPSNFAVGINFKKVKPTVFHRLFSEILLYIFAKHNDCVLCFGSLPPLLRLRAHTIVFVQNRFLVENVPLAGFKITVALRISIERLWLKFRFNNADEFIVQGRAMQQLLTRIGSPKKIRVLPFLGNTDSGYLGAQFEINSSEGGYDFVYVASGEPHKNHDCLLKAWCLLASEGIYPTLCLTISDVVFSKLCKLINVLIDTRSLRIFNVGSLPHEKVFALYSMSRAAIFPSKLESFGLPLIEAKNAGLPIIASELDYVRDISNPSQTFDPNSPISIARAVKRHLGLSEAPPPLMSAEDFLSKIFYEDKF